MFQEFTFGVAHEYDVDAIMGEIEVLENGGFIRYGDLLCTLMPLQQQRRQNYDEAGPNAPGAAPHDPGGWSVSTPTGIESVSSSGGFHSSVGGESATMRESSITTQNFGALGSTGARTATPDRSQWTGATPLSTPAVSSAPHLAHPEFSVAVPILMSHLGDLKGVLK